MQDQDPGQDRDNVRCIGCGRPPRDDLRWNLLADGRPCPACRERLLDAVAAPLPAALPAPGPLRAAAYDLQEDLRSAREGRFELLPAREEFPSAADRAGGDEGVGEEADEDDPGPLGA